jgi:hypothetical protein
MQKLRWRFWWWCRSTHAEAALAVLVMVPEHACRNCAGCFGDGAGHGEGTAWVYTNLMVASRFAMPSVAKETKDVMPCSRALLRCVGVRMSGCVRWHAQLATGSDLCWTTVAQDMDNHAAVPFSLQSTCGT